MIGILVAASTTEVVTTIYAYSILLAVIFSKGFSTASETNGIIYRGRSLCILFWIFQECPGPLAGGH